MKYSFILLLPISLMYANHPSASHYGNVGSYSVSHSVTPNQSHNPSPIQLAGASHNPTHMYVSDINVVDLLIQHVSSNVPGARDEARRLCRESGVKDLYELRDNLLLDLDGKAPRIWNILYKSDSYKCLNMIRKLQRRGYY